MTRPKVEHNPIWIVWDTEYVDGVAYEQIRAVCTEKWVAEIDAQIVREEALNNGRRVFVEVVETRTNHLFGWKMLLRLRKESLLNPDTPIEEFKKKLKELDKK